MLYSVTVENHVGDSMVLELKRPQDSGLIVTDITGIGPGDAQIITNSYAAGDGGRFNSARIPERNIVLYLEFMELGGDRTVEHHRHKVYKHFPLKKPVKLTFKTSIRELNIVGYVDSVEPVIFDEKSRVQVSLLCPEPYFRDVRLSDTWFYGEEPAFEFIFENDDKYLPKLEFGYIRSDTAQTVHYTGEADVGIQIHMHALGPVSGITIYNTATREHFKIDSNKLKAMTGSDIKAGDEIHINTVKGEKSIVLLRDGVETKILNCITQDSSWFQLTLGDNLFAYTASSGVEYLQFRIEHFVLYGGV